ncbi:type II toxin-antitoxin system RelE/ParE family toxin [Candidatus Bipolaricaulota bacterium]|nr:type II toxin-antitoxin system RelE/ParE family toxin [Candidatus Bipolaricaulota bacterium]MCK5586557.1 type II toxin-antitoxin system RelE/ParE family toxin [Candidatus Bipolaricaulota bacterium]
MPFALKTSSKFNRTAKKFPDKLKAALDDEVRIISENPEIGAMKKGDLAGIRVHKFGFYGRLYLLAYEVSTADEIIFIHALGGHENFYRDLKQYLKS